ncbi:hypothetical protein E1091_05740 [Micromonospora fluostatini]|uniref:PBS lyase n=1 Tax=Micromonospora fluostatini TaxID=1629071 RepID=A0ABY2DJ76_9ACTN|nr:hypothetical protein E1091_05740 [Micromonospora fluostatini]
MIHREARDRAAAALERALRDPDVEEDAGNWRRAADNWVGGGAGRLVGMLSDPAAGRLLVSLLRSDVDPDLNGIARTLLNEGPAPQGDRGRPTSPVRQDPFPRAEELTRAVAAPPPEPGLWYVTRGGVPHRLDSGGFASHTIARPEQDVCLALIGYAVGQLGRRLV